MCPRSGWSTTTGCCASSESPTPPACSTCTPDNTSWWPGSAPPPGGIEDLLAQFPHVELSLDSGYQGLAKLDPKRIVVPPPKPGKPASADETAVYQRARRHQSSERICVEHAIAETKTWRVLKRYHGKREHLAQIIDASRPWPPIGRPRR